MISHGRLDEHLKFLIAEVEAQLRRTQAFLSSPEEEPSPRLKEREDRINNLTVLIHRKAFALAPVVAEDERTSVDMLQAYAVVAANLESVADHCESVVEQVRYIEDLEVLEQQDFTPSFDLVLGAVAEIPVAVFGKDVDAALRICQAEHDLDQVYVREFHGQLEALQEQDKGESAQTLVTIIFILRYLERMGDALLNVGEAILGVCLGEPIKINRLRALEESLESTGGIDSIGDVSLRPMAETRSGCRISRVDGARGDGPVIFKQGSLRKLEAEKRNSEAWQDVQPGLAPTVQSFQRTGREGAILLDYLPGDTFEEIVLEGDAAALDDALGLLSETVTSVWTTTRAPQETPGGFMEQLTGRLPDVYSIHPRLRRGPQLLGAHEHRSFEALLADAQVLEAQLPSPFVVFAHGDFNVDNIIVNAGERQVHFIDLHRSRMLDYVQDVAVFLVSNHRLQAFDRSRRRRIARAMEGMFSTAQTFARSVGDETFEARLALGLARSWATSTRFVLVPWFARTLFLRSGYLLERLLSSDDPASFRLPLEVLRD